MGSSAAIFGIENALRTVVRELMPEWLETLTEGQQGRVSRARANEAGSREGVQTSDDLLDFTYTAQLAGLVLANWERFEPVFGSQTVTRGLLDFVVTVRNAPAHSRDLLPFERDLLAGTAGRLRNQVSIWRNRAESPTRYYPLIDSAVDGFGRSGNSVALIGDRPDGLPRVEYGDSIAFQVGASGFGRNFSVMWWAGSGPSVELPHSESAWLLFRPLSQDG